MERREEFGGYSEEEREKTGTVDRLLIVSIK